MKKKSGLRAKIMYPHVLELAQEFWGFCPVCKRSYVYSPHYIENLGEKFGADPTTGRLPSGSPSGGTSKNSKNAITLPFFDRFGPNLAQS